MGVASNFIGYLFFLFLIRLSVEPVIATGLTYVTILTGNYIVNRIWVFRSRGNHASDAPRYLLAYGIGFVTSMGSMKLLSGHMRPEFAQIFVILLSALVIYASLVLLRFGSPANDDAN